MADKPDDTDPTFTIRKDGDSAVVVEVRVFLPVVDPARINPAGVGVLRCADGELLILGDWLKR